MKKKEENEFPKSINICYVQVKFSFFVISNPNHKILFTITSIR